MEWDGDFSWSAWMQDEYQESMQGLYGLEPQKRWLMSLGFEEPLAHFLSLGRVSKSRLMLLPRDKQLWMNGPSPREVLQSYVTFKYDNWKLMESQLNIIVGQTERQKYLRALNDSLQRLNTLKKSIVGWQDIENILWLTPSTFDSGILISLNYPMGVRL